MSSVLPEDIIEENILTRLPVKSISRFRCVSKNWYHLFQNPNFIKKHLNHVNLMNRFNILVTNEGKEFDDRDTELNLFSIDNSVLSSTSSPFLGHALEIDYPLMSREEVPQILGSSNGLVCIKPVFEDICIWNPATREYKPIPEPPSADSDDCLHFAHGFGFDCKNDDYKVLRIESSVTNEEFLEASVYSLASNSWKNLGVIPYDFPLGVNKGFLLNGVLHWIATRILSSVLVCFDISDETFGDVPLPYDSSDEFEAPSILDLGVWEGKLCLLRTIHMENSIICTHQNDHVDVWTMMDNKWSKHLKITAHTTDMYYSRPIQTVQNGEILIEGGPREEEEGIGLISYDPKLERVRVLKIHGFPVESDVDTYIETLVPLNSGTYVNKTKKKRKSKKYSKKEKKQTRTTDGDLEL